MISPTEQQELLQRLESIAAIGAGTEIGRYRPLYSPDENQAVALVEMWMREAGLAVRHDAAGNLIGRLEGNDAAAPVIATGSHIDSVRNSGPLDGVLGALGAVTAVANLARRRGRPRVPLEAIVFRGEEGSRFPAAFFGSLAWVGRAERELSLRDDSGLTLAEAMQQAGYAPDRIGEARRQDLGLFIEMHIEQGGVLEGRGLPAGIVAGIVGVRWVRVRLLGVANHAGTTPMALRHDPVVAAARMIDAATRLIDDAGAPAVITCGRITARPGGANIVAGECEFTFDFRDLDRVRFGLLYEQLHEACQRIAAEHKVTIDWEPSITQAPVPCDQAIQETLRSAARELQLPYLNMASGAGHDAQVVAELCPVGMLFVPSIGGRSHCPEEATAPEAIQAGVSILTRALEQLAY